MQYSFFLVPITMSNSVKLIDAFVKLMVEILGIYLNGQLLHCLYLRDHIGLV